MKFSLKKLIICTVLVLIGSFFGSILYTNYQFCYYDKLRYINPDLACEDDPIISKKGYFDLKNKIQNFVKDKKDIGQIDYLSLYFRDLNNGPTLGINEHEKFSPASLLKIPVMLTFLNLQQEYPDILNTEIGFNNVYESLNQYYPPKVAAKENTPYKISDLISYMIKYSDNNSYYALREYLDQISPNEDLILETYTDLGITDPRDIGDQTLSVKSYGSIFVQLYNSSFFHNKELSEQALEFLVHTDFTDGIVQGIPSDVVVAHKFGERGLGNNKQLHDCGVIYYPKNPYLLCIMTRGPDLFVLSQIISDISKMVYDEVDSRKID